MDYVAALPPWASSRCRRYDARGLKVPRKGPIAVTDSPTSPRGRNESDMKRMPVLFSLNDRFSGCRAATVVFVLLVLVVAAVAPAVVRAGGLQSEEAVALTEKGKALLADGKPEEAVAELDEAIEVDQTFWEGWYQRGRALALLGRYEAATESLLRSTVLNPGHANARCSVISPTCSRTPAVSGSCRRRSWRSTTSSSLPTRSKRRPDPRWPAICGCIASSPMTRSIFAR